jgi:hypothetical protein
VALQDLVGRAWPHSSGDHRATGDRRRRETSLWRFHAGAAAGRRPPPSGRMRHAHMPRRAFLALALGWAFVVAMLLAAVLAFRWLG